MTTSEKYISCFDIRNFLDEIGKEGEESNELKYEFRKKYQQMERKNANQKIVLEQKEILNSLEEEHKIHINPNKKTVFVKINQLESGYLSYLKKKYNIPIDHSFIISLDQEKQESPKEKVEILSQLHKKEQNPFESRLSFIDDSFEIPSNLLKESMELVL